ncbi:hypothetical protein V5P93_000521 [Actinokineospora auranticolor]|uniref:Uncharacterized protein n=1 Tax=Actinokineospora auranticolor TaxID=155976 RepID=A0A2S6GZD7_9PSEU|nr:hypothetical protein [Actinokineospora auranticolor]PPK70599.1 hypothetical protein CLV40_102516 [Actinokineospora auranticolor]
MTKENGLRISQIAAGALAAATAAVLGSTLGLAGTVTGAAIASVITTVGGSLYLRSLERTTEGVRSVHAKITTRNGSVVSTDVSTDPPDADDVEEPTPDGPTPASRRPWALVAGAVLAFVLGMAVVTTLEFARGESLSGGQGTTVGNLVQPRETPPPTTTVTVRETPTTTPSVPPTLPPTMPSETGVTSAPPTTTTEPPATTTTPPVTSTTPPTTTSTQVTPPPTTTTAQSPASNPAGVAP